MGALVGVNSTELRDARVEHYEADMAITLEEKGVRTWTYRSIRDKGADHNKASLRRCPPPPTHCCRKSPSPSVSLTTIISSNHVYFGLGYSPPYVSWISVKRYLFVMFYVPQVLVSYFNQFFICSGSGILFVKIPPPSLLREWWYATCLAEVIFLFLSLYFLK